MGSAPSRWWRGASSLAAALVALVPAASSAGASAVTEPEPPASSVPASTTLDNPFLPDDTSLDLSDCISALPRPGCGSEDRSDWRQGALFGIVAAGMAAIGVRLAVGVRRRDRARGHADDD